MARPKVSDDERRTIVACRLTPELRHFVEQRAALKGMTISAWVERCIADAKARLEPNLTNAKGEPKEVPAKSRLKGHWKAP